MNMVEKNDIKSNIRLYSLLEIYLSTNVCFKIKSM